MIAPLLKKYAEKEWLDYIEKDINEATPEEIGEATSLPVVWFDDKQMGYDEVLAIITN